MSDREHEIYLGDPIEGERVRFAQRRRRSQRQTTTADDTIQMTKGKLQLMPASWIRDVKYNTLTNRLDIKMRHKWYGPWWVNTRTYLNFIEGKAVPVTTDTRRPARWAKGLGPSLGAAYHKYIKIGGLAPSERGALGKQVARKLQLLARIK